MGGALAKWNSAEISCVSCFSQISTHMSDVFTSENEIKAIANDEAKLCGSICGTRNIYLEYPPLHPAADEQDTQLSRQNKKEVEAALCKELHQLLVDLQPSRLYLPMYVEPAAEHAAVYRIGLDFFKQNHFPNLDYFFYDVFPYSASYSYVD